LLGVSAAAAVAEAAAAAAGAVKNLSNVEAPVGARLKLEADMNMVTMRKPLGLQGNTAQHSMENRPVPNCSPAFLHLMFGAQMWNNKHHKALTVLLLAP
jgi:hypothetical protein